MRLGRLLLASIIGIIVSVIFYTVIAAALVSGTFAIFTARALEKPSDFPEMGEYGPAPELAQLLSFQNGHISLSENTLNALFQEQTKDDNLPGNAFLDLQDGTIAFYAEIPLGDMTGNVLHDKYSQLYVSVKAGVEMRDNALYIRPDNISLGNLTIPGDLIAAAMAEAPDNSNFDFTIVEDRIAIPLPPELANSPITIASVEINDKALLISTRLNAEFTDFLLAENNRVKDIQPEVIKELGATAPLLAAHVEQGFDVLNALQTDAPIHTGSVSYVQGEVYITYPHNSTEIAADFGTPLLPGAFIRTEGDSFAEIALSDGSIVKLSDNTAVAINSIDSSRSEAEGVELFLQNGVVRAVVESFNTNDSFRIVTHSGVAGVRGTDFSVSFFEDMGMLVQVLEGQVALMDKGKTEVIGDRQKAQITAVLSSPESLSAEDLESYERFIINSSTNVADAESYLLPLMLAIRQEWENLSFSEKMRIYKELSKRIDLEALEKRIDVLPLDTLQEF